MTDFQVTTQGPKEFELSINDVDGVTYHHIQTDDRRYALLFLKKHDHEGAVINLRITTYNNEAIYKLLGDEK
jgi:hypothetical protein